MDCQGLLYWPRRLEPQSARHEKDIPMTATTSRHIRLRTAAALPASALLALVACGGDPPPEPDPPRATAIVISPESAEFSALGDTAVFTATVFDQYDEVFPGTVTWLSSDMDVFTVTAGGVANAAGNGSGTLTASFENLAATATVTVEQVPADLAVSPGSAALVSLGETAVFTATLTDANGAEAPGTPTWSSSDTAVFTVDAGGVATAAGNGAGTLTASFENLAATASVMVEQAPASLAVASGDDQEGTAGNPLAEPLAVRVDDAGGSPVEGVAVAFAPGPDQGSADPASAATGPDGLARTTWTLGADAGTQTLTASLEDGASVRFTASARPRTPPGGAAYRVLFEALWSDSTHPDPDFPSVPHFSPLIGGVHNDQVVFWELGDTASPGMEDMAEKGGTRVLAAEIAAHVPGNALTVVTAPGLRLSPGSRTIEELVFHPDYPLLTLVTMLGPSPDWFAGVSGLSLRDEDGEWVDELRIVLYPLDAGTDDGATYSAANEDTQPREPIRIVKGVPPFSEEPVGRFIFTRIHQPDGA